MNVELLTVLTLVGMALCWISVSCLIAWRRRVGRAKLVAAWETTPWTAFQRLEGLNRWSIGIERRHGNILLEGPILVDGQLHQSAGWGSDDFNIKLLYGRACSMAQIANQREQLA